MIQPASDCAPVLSRHPSFSLRPSRRYPPRLCKPPLNPLSHCVRTGIVEGLARAQLDDAISVVVITGGDKQAFSAGADIKEMADGDSILRLPTLIDVVDAIEACRVPVVAAIGGIALGGGCEVWKNGTGTTHRTSAVCDGHISTTTVCCV